jgi:hypothetical protein
MTRWKSPCPPPTLYQSEILTILMEECAEVQQRAAKMVRFGVEETQPGQPHTNAQRLSAELGDLMAVLDLARDCGLIQDAVVDDARAQKHLKLQRFLQNNPDP